MKCRYCERDRPAPCRNTRDMADFAIAGEFTCYDQIAELMGGEVGMPYIDANIRKNQIVHQQYVDRYKETP